MDRIILLAGPTEQATLSRLLMGHNPQLGIHHVINDSDLEAITPEQLQRARLVAFATPVIVPGAVLDRLGFGAYNFHPGSPDYPGLSPAQFAVYHRATRFGATAHAMARRVDEGPIVDVELFEVPQGCSVADLEIHSYRAMALMFWRQAKRLATQEAPLATLPFAWSGEKSSRRRYAALCDIPPDITADDLERRIEAFGGGYFGITPTISLHGHRFQLVPAPATETPEAVEMPKAKAS